MFDSVEEAPARCEPSVAGRRDHRVQGNDAQLAFESYGPLLGGALAFFLFVDPGVVDEVELPRSERIHADDAEELLAEPRISSVAAHVVRRNRSVTAQALGRGSSHALGRVESQRGQLRGVDHLELHPPPVGPREGP